MATIAGPSVAPPGILAHWRDMRAVEIPRDRWASFGALALGLAVAAASVGFHLLA